MRLKDEFGYNSKLSIVIWSTVEAATGLCVASAPALRPLIFRTSFLGRSASGSSLPSRSANVKRMELQDVRVTTTVHVTTLDMIGIEDRKHAEPHGKTVGAQPPFLIGPVTLFEARVEGGRASMEEPFCNLKSHTVV
jgi:hypothetical protein